MNAPEDNFSHVECDCRDPRHLIQVFVQKEDDGHETLYLAFQLNHYLPWYKRLKLAFFYVLGLQTAPYGAWDNAQFSGRNLQELRKVLG